MSPARPPTHTNSAPRRFHHACGDGVEPPALTSSSRNSTSAATWEYVLPSAFWPTSPTPACRCCGWATTSSSCLPRNPRPPAATDRGPDTPGRAARRLRRSAPTAAHRPERGDEPGRVEATVADDDARPRHPPGREQLSSPRDLRPQPRAACRAAPGPLHDTARLLLGALLPAVQGVAYLECAGEQRDRPLRHAQLLPARDAVVSTRCGRRPLHGSPDTRLSGARTRQ